MKYYDYYNFNDEINIALREYNNNKNIIQELQEEREKYLKENKYLQQKKYSERDNEILERKYNREMQQNLTKIKEIDDKIKEKKEKIENKIQIAKDIFNKCIQEKEEKIRVSEMQVEFAENQLNTIEKNIMDVINADNEDKLAPILKEKITKERDKFKVQAEEYAKNSEKLLEEKMQIEELDKTLAYNQMEKFIKLWERVSKEVVKAANPSTLTTPASTPTTPASTPTTPVSTPTTPVSTPTTPASTPTTPASTPTTPVSTPTTPASTPTTPRLRRRPEFLYKIKDIVISKEGVYIENYLYQDKAEMLQTYKNKFDGLEYADGKNTYVVDDVKSLVDVIFKNNPEDIIKIPKGVLKKIDPNVLMAIKKQEEDEIISTKELSQCVSMYLAALNGDKGSQDMLKGIITYDRKGIDYLKPSNLFDRIINRKAYKNLRGFADSHKSFATIISDVKGKIRAKLSKGNKNPELLDSPETPTVSVSTPASTPTTPVSTPTAPARKKDVKEEIKLDPKVVKRIEEIGRRANNPQPTNQNPEPQKEPPENTI